MKNIGVYFEIPVTDLERAIKFYSSVFECEFSRGNIHDNDMAFFSFNEDEVGITGALVKGETYKSSINGTLIYLRATNIEDVLQKVIKLGCPVLFPKTEVEGLGWSAEFCDCEGNRIALFQST